jgi:hypothetical protein
MANLENRTRGSSIRARTRDDLATVIRTKWLAIGANKVQHKDSAAKSINRLRSRSGLDRLGSCTEFHELFARSEKPS